MMIDCPALTKRCHDKGYPFGNRVPVRVRLTKSVHTDVLPGVGFISSDPRFAVTGQTYPAWTNSYGAVAIVYPDGRKLGVKPDEFEVVEWRDFD